MSHVEGSPKLQLGIQQLLLPLPLPPLPLPLPPLLLLLLLLLQRLQLLQLLLNSIGAVVGTTAPWNPVLLWLR